MAGINGWMVCTLGGGVVGLRIGGAKRGGTLDGEMVGGTLGLQLVAIRVLSLLSSLVRM
jgi:hypothetical protein